MQRNGTVNLTNLTCWIVIDQKFNIQYNNNILDQWDRTIPPLNLWNYSLYWKWVNEFESNKEHSDEHAS